MHKHLMCILRIKLTVEMGFSLKVLHLLEVPNQNPKYKRQLTIQKEWQHSEECMCRLRNIAMPDYQESVTNEQTDRHTDARQSDPYEQLCFPGFCRRHKNVARLSLNALQNHKFYKIVAAFRGMHVSPAKHSYVSVTDGRTDGQTDRRTDGRTEDGQSDPYVSLCFAGDTKIKKMIMTTKIS